MTEHSSEQIEKVITESLVSFGADADAINRDAELEALDIDSLDLAEPGDDDVGHRDQLRSTTRSIASPTVLI